MDDQAQLEHRQHLLVYYERDTVGMVKVYTFLLNGTQWH